MKNETKATHTQGEWVNDYSERFYKGHIVRMNGVVICRVASNPGIDEQNANARLIAAAPDLLSRLRECVDYLYAEADNAEDRNTGLIAECETVIRKATGEQD